MTMRDMESGEQIQVPLAEVVQTPARPFGLVEGAARPLAGSKNPRRKYQRRGFVVDLARLPSLPSGGEGTH